MTRALRLFLRSFAFVAALAVVGCHPRRAAPAAAPRTLADDFNLEVGGRIVHVQIAVRPEELERGLMFRRDLGADEGMLFVFAAPQRMTFWMRNTPIALDVGFFDAHGVLREIYPMYPNDDRTVASVETDLQFALEMNQGWFARSGVRPGARIDRSQLAAALRARGFDPAKYGF